MSQARTRSPRTLSARDLAYCGLFGAAGLLLPVLFHLFHLGHIFMPMYVPLVALGFFVSPRAAASTGAVVPLLSGAATGMPPFYPPVAVFMAIELAAMSALIAAVRRWRPGANEWVLLAVVLVLGRFLYVGLVYLFATVIELPAGFLAGLSLLSGWPGLVLMMVVIPPLARVTRGHGKDAQP